MSNKKNIKSVYVHIPFCKGKCLYCGFYSEAIGRSDVGGLLGAEIAELKKADIQQPIETIYIGGGSPSSIGEKLLCDFLEEIIAITGGVKEFTVEVNPGQVDESLLSNLYSLGVNRLSVGAQSFCDEQLRMLGRKHNAGDITNTIETAKLAGFENISLDLMFALPGGSVESWKETLGKAIDCKVKHISAYALSYEGKTPFANMKDDGVIEPVDEATDRAMYEMTIEMLGAAGIGHYEISNFAKAGFECRHNMVYWNDEDYLGIGPAAGGHIGNERKTNVAGIKKYVEAIKAGKDATVECKAVVGEDAAREKMVLGLRKIKGVHLEEFKDITGFDANELFGETISKYQTMGMMKIEDGFLSLTRGALPIADSVIFDCL